MAAVAALATLGVLFLGFQTGKAGGELVYHHGAAQAHIPAGAGSAVKVPRADDDDDDDDDDD